MSPCSHEETGGFSARSRRRPVCRTLNILVASHPGGQVAHMPLPVPAGRGAYFGLPDAESAVFFALDTDQSREPALGVAVAHSVREAAGFKTG